jgi:hypothetical protein
MAATKYSFTISTATLRGSVNTDSLKKEIQASQITIALNNGSEGQIETGGDTLDIWFANALSAGEQTLLTNIVGAHDSLKDAAGPKEGSGFVYNKTWAEMKSILDNNNLYFDYEDKGALRIITTKRNATSVYVCEMPIVASPAPGSDQHDFETNYMLKAGEKKYCYWTERNVFDKNAVSTYLFRLKNYCDAGNTPVDAFVFKGFFSVDENAVRGDKLTAAIVDHDNVFGMGVDAVVGYLVRKALLDGGKQRIDINPPSVDYIVNKKRIPAPFYVQLVYESQNQTNDVDVIVGIEYEY